MSTGGQQEGSRVDSATAHSPPQHTLMKLNAGSTDMRGGAGPTWGHWVTPPVSIYTSPWTSMAPITGSKPWELALQALPKPQTHILWPPDVKN